MRSHAVGVRSVRSARRKRERVLEGIEGMCAVNLADEPLTGSHVADVEKHALCHPSQRRGVSNPSLSRNASSYSHSDACGDMASG
jgi:hypothetical protein